MRYPILFSTFILFLFSCNKNKYNTVPSLKYKDVNTRQLQNGQSLKFTLSFTDAEGDLTDKIIYREVVKGCAASNFVDSSNFLPQFPTGKNQAGEIIITLRYIDVNPHCPPKNDTAIFKFVLRDKAQNKSDTAVSDPIIIYN